MNVRHGSQPQSTSLIVWAVILGLVALGSLAQFGRTDTGAEYLLFSGALVGCIGCAVSAGRARRPTPPPYDLRPGQTEMGWLAPWTPPSGHELAARTSTDDVPAGGLTAGRFDHTRPRIQLPWQADRNYLVLQDAEVPERWLRASKAPSGGFEVDAVLMTRGPTAADGAPNWEVLDGADRPVQLTDDPAGEQGPRAWVLLAGMIYRLDQDGRGGVHVLSGARPPGSEG